MATGKFSTTEWKQLVNAPQLILHLMTVTDRATFFAKRTESKSLEKFLSSYRSQSALVQSIIDGQKEADDKFDAKPDEAKKMLQQVGALLEAKSDDVEGDAVRDFLMDASQTIAEASRDQALGANKTVSDAEQETLDAIAAALRATETDKRRRHQAAVAAEAKRRAEEQEAKARREAEAKKKVEEARERREAEAKKKAEEEAKKKAETEARIKREAEARAQELQEMREAQIKKAEEQKAVREAQALKQKAEAAKQEAEAAKQAAEAAQKEAEAIYVVKSGDTLSGIAKKVYGKAGRWPEIFEANKDIIENPNLIRPGWKLRIP